MNIFETHAHYDDDAFDEDRDFLLTQMNKEGIDYIVNIGCSMENSRIHKSSSKKDRKFLYVGRKGSAAYYDFFFQNQ